MKTVWVVVVAGEHDPTYVDRVLSTKKGAMEYVEVRLKKGGVGYKKEDKGGYVTYQDENDTRVTVQKNYVVSMRGRHVIADRVNAGF